MTATTEKPEVPMSFVRFVKFYFDHYKLEVPTLYHGRDFYQTLFWFTLHELSDDWGGFWLLENSDITLSTVHYQYVITLYDRYSGETDELSPDEVLMYIKKPTGYDDWKKRLMKPGLNKDEISSVLSPFYNNVASFWPNHQADKRRIHIALWASMFWFAGPEASTWRSENHEVFAVVYQYGKGFINEWYKENDCFTVIAPCDAEFTGRTVQTCSLCGNTLHCVGQYHTEGGSKFFLCKHCAKENLPMCEWNYDEIPIERYECSYCINPACPKSHRDNMIDRFTVARQKQLALTQVIR